jgi:hypothetical protein
MAAPDSIKILVEEFERLKGGPAPDSFDEAQLCTSFIEPFWEALGWGVRDPREVVKEKRVHLRASTKHADYCFQLKGKPQFVLEAKDYRRRLDDADFIFQTKRYGYNLPVDFGVLTNFAEFRLYDTGLQPVYENRGRGLFKPYHLQYTDYEDRWDEVAAVFSREAVAAGALRDLLPKARRTRNKEALDRTFFEGLNEWRAELARVIALRNPDVGVHDINEAVQRILDRCIFMRVIEDREIEAVELLLDALNRWEREREKPLYRYMVDKFRYLEPQYNGELFERDQFFEDLLIDDKPLKEFIESLYYPRCPYQFNVVGVEMLGTIYERFLGSTIRLTPTHRAVVEEKPEVRKAGGVYYTPKYIVDYIVENTVGELLAACKTPAAAARLKILDPACGSGSFLLGAFQRLIDWHEDYFNANPDRISKGPAAECWRDEEAGRWRLGAKFKGRILVNNIFGVDVDEQACEVTRMSLYLKVLEDVNAQYLIKTALLPPLDANIKCGNSLIGSDYFDVGQTFLSVDEEERRRVNPFDWDVEFGEIMKAGGFDAVIGNPPYGRNFGEPEEPYILNRFKVYSGVKDIYPCLIEASTNLLRLAGYLSFIVPSAWLGGPAYKVLREFLLQYAFKFIVLLPFDVFVDAYVDTCVFVLLKIEDPKRNSAVRTLVYGKREKITIVPGEKEYSEIVQSAWYDNEDKKIVLEPEKLAVISKIAELGAKNFKDFISIKRGVLFDILLLSDNRLGDFYYPYFEGDVYRYLINEKTERWVEFGDNMKERPKEISWFEGERILLRRLVNRQQRLMACVEKDTYITNKNLYSIKTVEPGIPYPFLLGILNSKLISFLYLAQVTQATKDDFPQVTIKDILDLPFPELIERTRHDKMVALVEEMLELHKRLAAAKSDADKHRLQRAVAATDRKIDNLVYELYGLTDEEIRIVEGSQGRGVSPPLE